MSCGTLRTPLRNLWNWTRGSTYLGKLLPTWILGSNSSKASRIKVFPIQFFSGTSKLSSWIDVANAFIDIFASNFNTNSDETRIPDYSQSLIFFNDFCGSFSDSDVRVILSSTACSYETHDDFPKGQLKKCSGLCATLFRIVFNCVILNCQFPKYGSLHLLKLFTKELAGTTSPITVHYSAAEDFIDIRNVTPQVSY